MIHDSDTFRLSTLVHDGPYENILYLLTDKASGQSAVIDPAWDLSLYEQMAGAAGGRIAQVWLTHSHGDHVNALDTLLAAHPVPAYISAAERAFWRAAPAALHSLDDGAQLQLGETRAQLLLTPGHTPGSACFVLDGHLIAGDTLFTWGCGRCDLPGGDPDAMFDSLQRLRALLPAATLVHGGHHYADREAVDMAAHIAGNPFLHCRDKAEFHRYRMEHHDATRRSPYRAMRREEMPL